MEFAFTEEQEMIRDTAAAFLAEVSDSEAVRRAMATESGYDEQLWQRICSEMYWQAIHLPEDYGGMGLGYVELVATMEQMGRYLLCSPFSPPYAWREMRCSWPGPKHKNRTGWAGFAKAGPPPRWRLTGASPAGMPAP